MWAASCVDIDAICYITITCIDQVVIMLEKNITYKTMCQAVLSQFKILSFFFVLCHGTETVVLAPCAAPVCLSDTSLLVIASVRGGASNPGWMTFLFPEPSSLQLGDRNALLATELFVVT